MQQNPNLKVPLPRVCGRAIEKAWVLNLKVQIP